MVAGVVPVAEVVGSLVGSSFCAYKGTVARSVHKPKHAKKTLHRNNNLLLNNIPVKSVKVDFRQIVFSAFFISSSRLFMPGSAFIVF